MKRMVYAVIVLAALWSGLWLVQSYTLRSQIDGWFDARRAEVAEESAARVLRRTLERMAGELTGLAVVLRPDGDPRLRAGFEAARGAAPLALFEAPDDALEAFENDLLAADPALDDPTRFAFAQIELFKGLEPEDYRLLEREVQVFAFAPGETVVREGDLAVLLYVIARGTVSVQISLPDGRRKRVACMGPGLPVGEMALIDGGRRSADVIADEEVVCYGFSIERLRALAAERPTLLVTIMSNLARALSERLRGANDEIRSLE